MYSYGAKLLWERRREGSLQPGVISTTALICQGAIAYAFINLWFTATFIKGGQYVWIVMETTF
jgi:hypothetical protein